MIFLLEYKLIQPKQLIESQDRVSPYISSMNIE